MTESELIACTSEYLKISEELKKLEAQKKQLGASLLEHMKSEQKDKLLLENVAKLAVTKQVRDVPQTKIIEETFGITLTPECFKHSESQYVKVTSLLNESAAE